MRTTILLVTLAVATGRGPVLAGPAAARLASLQPEQQLYVVFYLSGCFQSTSNEFTFTKSGDTVNVAYYGVSGLDIFANPANAVTNTYTLSFDESQMIDAYLDRVANTPTGIVLNEDGTSSCFISTTHLNLSLHLMSGGTAIKTEQYREVPESGASPGELSLMELAVRIESLARDKSTNMVPEPDWLKAESEDSRATNRTLPLIPQSGRSPLGS